MRNLVPRLNVVFFREISAGTLFKDAGLVISTYQNKITSLLTAPCVKKKSLFVSCEGLLIAQSSNKCTKNVNCSCFGFPYCENNVKTDVVGLIQREAQTLTDFESPKDV